MSCSSEARVALGILLKAAFVGANIVNVPENKEH